MLPYFYKLEKKLVSEELLQTFRNIALKNIDQFTTHIDDNGNSDGNNYLYHEDLQNFPEINQLRKRSNIDFYIILYMHKPNSVVVKHRDNPKYRKTNIIHPLLPLEEYASTMFYESYEHQTPIICEYKNDLPVILNLSKFHSVNNNNNYRINLQFSFKEDFDTLVNLYKDQKIFNL